MTEPVELSTATWPSLEGEAARSVLLVPVGSCEQHGPHLPFATDTVVATELAHRAATGSGPPVVVAPPLAYGASGEHAGFTGTLSIGTEVLAAVLTEIGRSADAFAGVVFVNGHGGNAEALARAEALLRHEGRNVTAWSWRVPGADAHAGRTETSLLLAIDPELVRLDAAAPGRTEPLGELLDELRDRGVRPVSPNGVLGDPTGASAAEGAALLDDLVADLVATIADVAARGPA